MRKYVLVVVVIFSVIFRKNLDPGKIHGKQLNIVYRDIETIPAVILKMDGG